MKRTSEIIDLHKAADRERAAAQSRFDRGDFEAYTGMIAYAKECEAKARGLAVAS